MLKDAACLPPEAHTGVWLKPLIGTGHRTVVELPMTIQVRTSLREELVRVFPTCRLNAVNAVVGIGFPCYFFLSL